MLYNLLFFLSRFQRKKRPSLKGGEVVTLTFGVFWRRVQSSGAPRPGRAARSAGGRKRYSSFAVFQPGVGVGSEWVGTRACAPRSRRTRGKLTCPDPGPHHPA